MDKKVLVIVESPTKARTIKKFLPSGYTVEASVGHIRDLPQSASEIPAEYKSQEWAKLGIDVEHDFAPLYVTPKGKGKLVTQLKKLVKESDTIYLATDEDREGESISWHLVEVLKPKGKEVKRMVFHEITKEAIQEAIKNTRDINADLVKAQETRRVLDRLYGFTLSPLLWKKIAFGLSAGRVQSPGLRLIVQRELERINFKKSTYHDLLAQIHPTSQTKAGEDQFEARLISVGGKRVAGGKDFDPDTGLLKTAKDLLVLDGKTAEKLLDELKTQGWKVLGITEKETNTKAAMPFITSTLQQEANRKLGLSSRETMRIAQKLYEEGLITYMRTDSPNLSTEAIAGARKSVETLYGSAYLSKEPKQYNTKSKNAQEAHEAIRPAGSNFVHPDETNLVGREKSLYEMIWKRTLASQMADAQKLSMAVRLGTSSAEFQANGSRILFPGFLRVYVEGSDDPEAALEDKEVLLPKLTEGQAITLDKLSVQSHETKPPARYTEASLIQRLEKEEIGRPSTYASIVGVLYERDYVRKVGAAMAPTYTGMCVSQFLENNFHELVDYRFTSAMEEALDEIALGQRDRLTYLKGFYSGEAGIKHQVESRDKSIKVEDSRTVKLPQLAGKVELKIGRFGPYVVQKADGDEIHASIPEDIPPADLVAEDVERIVLQQKDGPAPIGTDPSSGESVYCLTGRYGPYVQLGEVSDSNPKPRRATLPRGMDMATVDIATALRLLSLPRNLGKHPETGVGLVANNGRFGPYVQHGEVFRSLKKEDDVYTISLARAVELLAEEKKGRGGTRVIRVLGKTTDDTAIELCEGRYGPYLKVGAENIRLPDEFKTVEALESLSFDQVIPLVNAHVPSTKTKSKSKKTTTKS